MDNNHTCTFAYLPGLNSTELVLLLQPYTQSLYVVRHFTLINNISTSCPALLRCKGE